MSLPPGNSGRCSCYRAVWLGKRRSGQGSSGRNRRRRGRRYVRTYFTAFLLKLTACGSDNILRGIHRIVSLLCTYWSLMSYFTTLSFKNLNYSLIGKFDHRTASFQPCMEGLKQRIFLGCDRLVFIYGKNGVQSATWRLMGRQLSWLIY